MFTIRLAAALYNLYTV